jgi:hypothetical protein
MLRLKPASAGAALVAVAEGAFRLGGDVVDGTNKLIGVELIGVGFQFFAIKACLALRNGPREALVGCVDILAHQRPRPPVPTVSRASAWWWK